MEQKKMKKELIRELILNVEPAYYVFEHCGYKCEIVRNSHLLTYCGYVSISETNHLYGKSYDHRIECSSEIEDKIADAPLDILIECLNRQKNIEENGNYISISLALSPHGGVTYSNQNEELWKFGFDCGHYTDIIPSMFLNEHYGDFYPYHNEEYRNFNYVKEEVKKLAEKLRFYERFASERGYKDFDAWNKHVIHSILHDTYLPHTVDRIIELTYKEAKKSKWIEFDFHNKSTHPTQYGDYWVYRADCNKSHKEVWNGSGWAYNNKTITHWQPLPEKP